MLSPSTLLRSAAVLTFLHAVLHTFGGLLSAPQHGPEEIFVLDTMQSRQFDFMGSQRSYWDFYIGFGLFLTVSLLMQAALLWLLAALTKAEPSKAHPLIAVVLVGFMAAIALSWQFFFIAPLVMEILIGALVGLAYWFSRERVAE